MIICSWLLHCPTTTTLLQLLSVKMIVSWRGPSRYLDHGRRQYARDCATLRREDSGIPGSIARFIRYIYRSGTFMTRYFEKCVIHTQPSQMTVRALPSEAFMQNYRWLTINMCNKGDPTDCLWNGDERVFMWMMKYPYVTLFARNWFIYSCHIDLLCLLCWNRPNIERGIYFVVKVLNGRENSPCSVKSLLKRNILTRSIRCSLHRRRCKVQSSIGLKWLWAGLSLNNGWCVVQ